MITLLFMIFSASQTHYVGQPCESVYDCDRMNHEACAVSPGQSVGVCVQTE